MITTVANAGYSVLFRGLKPNKLVPKILGQFLGINTDDISLVIMDYRNLSGNTEKKTHRRSSILITE